MAGEASLGFTLRRSTDSTTVALLKVKIQASSTKHCDN